MSTPPSCKLVFKASIFKKILPNNNLIIKAIKGVLKKIFFDSYFSFILVLVFINLGKPPFAYFSNKSKPRQLYFGCFVYFNKS